MTCDYTFRNLGIEGGENPGSMEAFTKILLDAPSSLEVGCCEFFLMNSVTPRRRAPLAASEVEHPGDADTVRDGEEGRREKQGRRRRS
jgi:hypothetical protein